jgi:hypothetical protein
MLPANRQAWAEPAQEPNCFWRIFTFMRTLFALAAFTLATTLAAPALAQGLTAPAEEAPTPQTATHDPTPLFRPEGHVTVASWPEAQPAIPVQQAVLVEPRK